MPKIGIAEDFLTKIIAPEVRNSDSDNHDLWTLPTEPDHLRGVAKYERLVALCRDHGVLTPEDPYVTWPGDSCMQVIRLR